MVVIAIRCGQQAQRFSFATCPPQKTWTVCALCNRRLNHWMLGTSPTVQSTKAREERAVLLQLSTRLRRSDSPRIVGIESPTSSAERLHNKNSILSGFGVSPRHRWLGSGNRWRSRAHVFCCCLRPSARRERRRIDHTDLPVVGRLTCRRETTGGERLPRDLRPKRCRAAIRSDCALFTSFGGLRNRLLDQLPHWRQRVVFGVVVA
jgi:hypothetical protein